MQVEPQEHEDESGLGYRPGRQIRERLPFPRAKPMRGAYAEAILHETYSLKARAVQRGARLFVQPFLKALPVNDQSIRTLQSLDRAKGRSRHDRAIASERLELGGVAAESSRPKEGRRSELVVLYLHGGAFISGSLDTHRRVCERLALMTGGTVYSADYVQLPAGNVADSVQDAMRAYEGLLAIAPDPGKVVVAGDSAGGYLAMKVAELATRRGWTRPAAVLAFSPLLSLDPDREDKAVERIDPVNDAYLPPSKLPEMRDLWLPEGVAIEGFAAPLHAARYITCPVFLTATEDELLRPEVEGLAVRLAERGTTVELHLWRKQVHAFPVFADLLPESMHALRLAADFALAAAGERDWEASPQGEPEASAEAQETLEAG